MPHDRSYGNIFIFVTAAIAFIVITIGPSIVPVNTNHEAQKKIQDADKFNAQTVPVSASTATIPKF